MTKLKNVFNRAPFIVKLGLAIVLPGGVVAWAAYEIYRWKTKAKSTTKPLMG